MEESERVDSRVGRFRLVSHCCLRD
uniref:Uncharacterized protein n=1 Tax=Rhizophora mucronata TaxID=61149 RepID=A0A2P2MIY0_RHIMU